MNIVEENMRVITCPICGRVLEKTRSTSKENTCKCGSEVTTLVTKGFVANIIHEPGESNKSFQERLLGFQKQLNLLIELS